jgi:hypothetical protein
MVSNKSDPERPVDSQNMFLCRIKNKQNGVSNKSDPERPVDCSPRRAVRARVSSVKMTDPHKTE